MITLDCGEAQDESSCVAENAADGERRVVVKKRRDPKLESHFKQK